MTAIKSVILELRIKHYIKNSLVFLPLVFSMKLTEAGSAFSAFIAFLALCAGSSAVYALNDIIDRENDALHPEKSKRPIASGVLSVKQGWVIFGVCLAVSLSISIIASFEALAFTALYIAVNIAYCLFLKKIVIVDVFCIAAGFILRVMAGAAAINVPVSDWLLLTVMALSLFMGFGKRRGEMRLEPVKPGGLTTRKVLENYSDAFLDKAMYSMMTLAIAFYALWSIDRGVAENLGTDKLFWSVPFVIAGLLRYSQQIEKTPGGGDPTGVIFGDKPIFVIIAAYVAFVLVIVYVI